MGGKQQGETVIMYEGENALYLQDPWVSLYLQIWISKQDWKPQRTALGEKMICGDWKRSLANHEHSARLSGVLDLELTV